MDGSSRPVQVNGSCSQLLTATGATLSGRMGTYSRYRKAMILEETQTTQQVFLHPYYYDFPADVKNCDVLINEQKTENVWWKGMVSKRKENI